MSNYFRIHEDWIYIPEQKILTNKALSDYETHSMKKPEQKIKNGLFLNATIILTNECNLNCRYCYSSLDRKAGSISFGTVKNTIDRTIINNNINLYRDNKVNDISFIFIGGGEPTLSWDVFEKSVSYINELSRKIDRNIHTALVSNGQWLSDERNKWLAQNISHISFSLDGGSEMQNFQRSSMIIADTYKHIEKNIKFFQSAKKSFGIRATISDYNMKHLDEIIDIFVSFEPSVILIEPLSVNTWSGDISAPDADEFVERYFQVIEKHSSIDCKIYTSLDMYKDNREKGYFCDYEYGKNIVLTPSGYVTSCVEVSSEDNDFFNYFCVGKADDNKIHFVKTDLDEKKLPDECQNCILKIKCRGGCPIRMKMKANAYQCDIAKKIFYKRLLLIIQEQKNNSIINL